MGLNFGDLFLSGLLFLNAVAVLNEERFLAKRQSSQHRLSPSEFGVGSAFAAWFHSMGDDSSRRTYLSALPKSFGLCCGVPCGVVWCRVLPIPVAVTR